MHIDLPLGVHIYIGAMLFALGAAVGSFVTCAADRYCHKQSFWRGRSHCDSCGATLTVADLVPIFSYLFLKGKCRHCGAKIPPRCLVIELLMAALYAGTYAVFGFSFVTLEYLALFSALTAIALVDLDTMEIPDGLLLFCAAVFVAFAYPHGQNLGDMLARIKDGLLGAVVYGGGILIIALVMDKVLGRESMGGGDVKLFAVVGLFTGLAGGLLMLLTACIAGIVTALCSGLRKEAFPFGPSIAGAAVLTLLLGQKLIEQYLALIY